MKLLKNDYILIVVIILLLFILYHLIKNIDDEGLLYNKESILTKMCRKEHSEDNPNYKFRLLLKGGVGGLINKDINSILEALLEVELSIFAGLNVKGVFLSNNINI